ncbi:MAG: hypothetical protein QM775_27515 [Pirellulales bacterium]
MGLLRRFYKKLPYMRELNDIRDLLQTLVARSLDEYAAHALPQRSQRSDPRHLSRYERQVFSQNGEDGILAEIFRRIGVTGGRFVEIGAGNGLENNSAYLLLQGWSGLWVDAHPKMAATAHKQYGPALEEKRLKLAERFVDAENVGPLFQEFGMPVDFELLSLDIDRNTYYVWEALAAYRPKVVAVEYNAKIPPNVDWKVEYDPQRSWNGTSYFGASLKAYELLGAARLPARRLRSVGRERIFRPRGSRRRTVQRAVYRGKSLRTAPILAGSPRRPPALLRRSVARRLAGSASCP